MDQLHVIVADDEKAFANGLGECLAREPDIIVNGVVYNGRDALRLALETLPDVVLIDLDMPVLDGISALRQLKQLAPGVEAVVLTVFADDAHLFAAMQAGARGYLLKNTALDAIAQALRDVANGHASLSPLLAGRMLDEFQRVSNQMPALCDLFSKLTHQEAVVLKRLTEHKTNPQIAAALFIQDGTVKKHVGNILKKLEVNNRTEAALLAQRNGLGKT